MAGRTIRQHTRRDARQTHAITTSRQFAASRPVTASIISPHDGTPTTTLPRYAQWVSTWFVLQSLGRSSSHGRPSTTKHTSDESSKSLAGPRSRMSSSSLTFIRTFIRRLCPAVALMAHPLGRARLSPRTTPVCPNGRRSSTTRLASARIRSSPSPSSGAIQLSPLQAKAYKSTTYVWQLT